jgi:hypothetical protein
VETGTPQSLETPAGTLTFNDFTTFSTSGTLMITKITGFHPRIRNPIDSRAGKAGAILHPFLPGERIFTLEGLILCKDNATRSALEDTIRGKVASCLAADARYHFTPSGFSARFIVARAYDQIEITDAQTGSSAVSPSSVLKMFTITLVAGDPVAYTYTETDTTIAAGATVTVTNAGNIASFPVAEVYGPFTAMTLSNLTTGLDLIMTGGSGVADGHFCEIIMDAETIYLDAVDGPLLGQVDFDNSDFWSLAPSANSIQFHNITGGGANTHVYLKSNSGWA